MVTIDKDVSWYALQVRPRFEKIVSRNLYSKGYEEFVPLYKRISRWSDRTKEIELPLFPGYVFYRFNVHQRLPILMIPGVNSVVGVGQNWMPVEQRELDDVRTLLQSGSHCEPWPYHLEVGQIVQVERGPLAGTQGFVARVKDTCRLVVSVNLLQRSVAVEIDRDCLAPISGDPELCRNASPNSPLLARY